MKPFQPIRFRDIYDLKLGKDIVEFLSEHDNIIRMVTAVELRRPPVEAIASRFKVRFLEGLIKHISGKIEKELTTLPEIRDDDNAKKIFNRIKQFVGFVAKHIMEENGFTTASSGVPLKNQEFFNSATKYK